MPSSTRSLARAAESSPFLRVMARGGFAANGVVHILIGVIAIAMALGGRGDSSQTGAFMAIAQAPLGFVALWALAVALCALGLWHALEGVLARDVTGDVKGAATKWGRRTSEWGQSAVFFALGMLAASVALGARPDSGQSARDASRGVLSIPGGPIVLGIVGLGIGAGGVAFIVMGFLRSFEKKMDIPDHALGTTVKALGVIGFIAKGIALVIVGVLAIVAAITVDAAAAGGLDAAVRALLSLVLGPLLVAVIGVGLSAYGVFCLFRARYAAL